MGGVGLPFVGGGWHLRISTLIWETGRPADLLKGEIIWVTTVKATVTGLRLCNKHAIGATTDSLSIRAKLSAFLNGSRSLVLRAAD